MYENYNLLVFNDGIGRTCFGEVIEETENVFKVKNPAMIMVTPNEAGQMKVDVIPLFFAEFVKSVDDQERQSVFNVIKNNITVIDVSLTDKILEHYFTKINIKEVEAQVPEITLFEE